MSSQDSETFKGLEPLSQCSLRSEDSFPSGTQDLNIVCSDTEQHSQGELPGLGSQFEEPLTSENNDSAIHKSDQNIEGAQLVCILPRDFTCIY